MPTPETAPLLWRVEREDVRAEEVPLASLVSVAYADGEYFLVARGDIAPVVGRPFDPNSDIPTGRLEVSLEVGGLPAKRSSATYSADRDTWQALLRWKGIEPAPVLRARLELDGRSREYVLALVDSAPAVPHDRTAPTDHHG